MVSQLQDYADAAELLYGEIGRWSYRAFDAYNAELFGGSLLAPPVTFGLSAYGRCIGLTRGGERIFLTPQAVRTGDVRGVLLHEMVHYALHLSDGDPKHAGADWPALWREIADALGLPELADRIERVRSVRLPDGIRIRKGTPDGCLTRAELARLPHSVPELAAAVDALAPPPPEGVDWLH